MENLRLRRHDGPAADDPFWRAVGLHCAVERARLLASAERSPAGGDTDIQLWLLSGQPLTFRISTRWPVRALRVLVAEHFACCVGQVRLLLETSLEGLTLHSALLGRIAEPRNCSPDGVRPAAGNRDLITHALRDKLSLHDYGCRADGRVAGRLCAVINDSDAVGHCLHA